MRKIALIPARYAASRFPGKLMQLLNNEPVIVRTYQAVLSSGLFDEVAVVTDSDEIAAALDQVGAKVYRSTEEYACGTDRIAAFASSYREEDIIVNVQGDEPFVAFDILKSLIASLENNPTLDAATPMELIKDLLLINNPNAVKVVMDRANNAILFSRSPIPYHRNQEVNVAHYKHIGIYAFRQRALMAYASLPIGPLEAAEQLEGLRFIENGMKIKLVLTQSSTQGIDTPEDLVKAQMMWTKINANQ